MLSAARLPQVRAEACISLQASWEQVNSSNCLNHVRRTKSSIKKRIIVRRTVRSMFGEQTFAQLRTGFTAGPNQLTGVSVETYLFVSREIVEGVPKGWLALHWSTRPVQWEGRTSLRLTVAGVLHKEAHSAVVTILDSSSSTVSDQVDKRNQYLSIKQATLIADVRKDNELNLFCNSRHSFI